jgi:two-component system response regulator (stage 0 sporulation protein F)
MERDKRMRPATILIIEDQTSIRLLLARVLEEAGYQVHVAANGRQGLDQIHTQLVDLVITDLEMPEMNGLEVILELTRTFSNVKVIAMSGRSTNELSMAKLLGARQTLVKPFDLSALLHAVQDELQHTEKELHD